MFECEIEEYFLLEYYAV